ncbi:hypothetical protein Tco_0857918 [Tanacetum coccineum]|uniref:Uncharacterized protein n=1 Tax=Tanacetum coccineum TaxID=301880 RepID=A0ABQ5BBH2_9ASTR
MNSTMTEKAGVKGQRPLRGQGAEPLAGSRCQVSGQESRGQRPSRGLGQRPKTSLLSDGIGFQCLEIAFVSTAEVGESSIPTLTYLPQIVSLCKAMKTSYSF